MNNRSTYPTHASLLDQVADSREEAAEVRRILGQRLTEAELDDAIAAQRREDAWRAQPWPYAPANHAHRHSRACSRCESGLAQCATPEACERADEARTTRSGDLVGIWALILAVWAAIVFALVATGISL